MQSAEASTRVPVLMGVIAAVASFAVALALWSAVNPAVLVVVAVLVGAVGHNLARRLTHKNGNAPR